LASDQAARFWHLEKLTGGRITIYHRRAERARALTSRESETHEGIKSWLKGTRTIHPGEKAQLAPIQFDKRRIAVLPFANISLNPSDYEYFSDGMTEELIATMSKISGLQVIARTSMMTYKGCDGQKKINEIARELEAGTILEGSVRKSGDRLRITIQAIDSATSGNVWAETYDRELSDVFAIQSDISRMVAETLRVKLLASENIMLGKKESVNPEAYTLYLKGRFYWNERTKEKVEIAEKYFEAAAKLDPTFAFAVSGLADCYVVFADYGWVNPSFAYPRAKEFCIKALDMDDHMSEAHASLSWVQLAYYWDFIGAEREINRAIELRPSYATAYHWSFLMMFFLRRYEEGYLQEKKAIELDPVAAYTNMGFATALATIDKVAEAKEQFKQLVERYPNYAGGHMWNSAFQVSIGEFDTGIKEARKAFDLDGTPINESFLAWAYASSGNENEAQELLEHLLNRKDAYVFPAWIGLVELSLGRLDEGYRWLEKSLAERNQALLYFRGMPWFKQYHADPRWNRIEEKIGLRRPNMAPKSPDEIGRHD
jgi:TolB-like protein